MHMCYNFFRVITMKTQTILFFDVDSTIYDPVSKRVPIKTIEAFKLLKKRQDVLIAIATGRAFYMLKVIEVLKPYIDIYITINGQIILYDNVIIHQSFMDRSDVLTIQRVLEEKGLVYGYYGINHQAISEYTPYAHRMFEAANMPIPKVIDLNTNEENIYQMWAFSSKKTTKDIQTTLKDFLVVPWLGDGFDILMPAKTKKEGVEFVLQYFNLTPLQAICFGDSDNDIEMLKYIPCSVAMGNSLPHIKKCAKYVTKHIEDDGIYHALVKLNLIKE